MAGKPQKNKSPKKNPPGKGARSREGRGTAAPIDAIALLEGDHLEVENYFSEYDNLESPDDKKAVAEKICLALTVHATIEEEYLYPAARDAADASELLDNATVEHAGAKILIAEIEAMQPGQPLYDAKVRVLGEQIRQHVMEEEGELFPRLRESRLDLKQLGQLLMIRKAELFELLAE